MALERGPQQAQDGERGDRLAAAGLANEAERLNKLIYEMMAQNCGKSSDYFLKIADQKKHADWFLDADEAKQHGIINHIRVPTLRTKVVVEIDFE